MIKLAQNLVRLQQVVSKRGNLNGWRYGIEMENRKSLTNEQQYGYLNVFYKLKVMYNIVNLVEDDRKVYFFMKIVDKYYKEDINKVEIGSGVILKSIKDPKYLSKVRVLLLTALQKSDNPNFYQLLQIRIQLINDLINSNDKEGAQKYLYILKDNYKELVQRSTPAKELEAIMHHYIISNLQIQNYSEALIFADKLKLQFEKSKLEITDEKGKEDILIPKAISLYSYFWNIYRNGYKDYPKAMEQYNHLFKLIEKRDKKLVSFLLPKSLMQFEEFMIDVLQFAIEKKEFEKSASIFQFYIKNYYKTPEKQKQFKDIPDILKEIDFYYNYIILAQIKFQKLPKIEQNDLDIFAYTVEEYYKYSILINTEIGIELHSFEIHDIIKKISPKLTATTSKRVNAAIYRFDQKIKDIQIIDESEEEKKKQEEEEEKVKK